MSRLTRDQHARATKKPSSSAAQFLLQHGGRVAATNGESIEFFSDLRRCQPDEPRASSGQTERRTGRPMDGREKATRRGSRAGSDELLSSEIGKHDYDWLLTPPATPLWSPATSASGHQVSAPAANRLERAGSASYAKTKSQLGPSHPTGRETENPTSRLARSSSSAIHPTSVNVPAIASSGHVLHVRTPSWASATSINSATSNLSVGSTLFGSPATSPRSPVTASSAALTARPCRRTKPTPAAGQCRMSPCSPRLSVAASSSRTQATSGQGGVSSPRSTTSTSASRQAPSLTGRVSAAPRSRLASQSTGTWSTARPTSPATPTRGARAVLLSSGKPWQAPAAVKHSSAAVAASVTTQRWRQSLSPVIAAARREGSLASRSPRNSDGRKSSAEKAAPHRATAVTAAGGVGLERIDSRKSATTHAANRVVNEKGDRRRQDAAKSSGGAPASRTLTLLQQSILSVTSRSRRGPTATASEPSSSVASGRSTPVNGQHVAAAARIAEADALPSARYDAMLLREDPKNLTWLRGCDDGDGSGGGCSDLVDSSLEPFYV